MEILKKNRSILYLILSILLSCNSYSQHQKITFEHFKLENGEVSMINCVFQDRIGYIWMGSYYYGLYRYDGYSFKRYNHKVGDKTTIANAIIETICDDSEGNIWIGHTKGLDKFNPASEIFTHYTLNPKLPLTDWSNHVLSLHEDRLGNLWVGTGNGLYLYNKKTQNFKRIIHDSTDVNSIIHNAVNAIYEDRSGAVWFGTGGGLEKLDASGKFIHYWNDPKNSTRWDVSPHWILTVFEDRDGIMWLGTSGGLVEFNRNNNSFNLYKHNSNDPDSLVNNVIGIVREDQSGNLWISAGGLSILNKKTKKFTNYYYNESDPGSISSNNISGILIEKSGTIWITTIGGGVNKYIPPKVFLKEYSLGHYGDIFNLVEDNNGKMWIPTAKGLLSYDPKKEGFKEEPFKTNISVLLDKAGTLWISSGTTGNIFYKKNNDEQINQFFDSRGKAFHETVSTMCNGFNGDIWIGTSDGKILKLDPAINEVEQMEKFDYGIRVIYQDKKGLLWIGTNEGGAFCYNQEQKTFERFSSDPNDSKTLSGNKIMDFREDGTGTLWIIANSILNKFDRENKKFIRMSERDGFPINAYSLMDDDSGNLWINTKPAGTIKYNPITKGLRFFTDIELGVPFKMKSGELYFITISALKTKLRLVRVNPDSLKNNSFIPPIVITEFRKFEKHFPFGKEIKLSYDENFISFEFSALSYISPERNQYAYKMEGIDKDWVYSGTSRFASYPNLDPGEYTFRVKGSNNDGVWNEAGTSIAIIISPPWWKTWWAYTLYTGFFLFALYGIRHYEMSRLSLKNQIKTERAVLKEREEADKMKSRFFANISHEFRTPLTLILGPAEKIISDTSDDHIKDANIIKRNSRRLLQLINQLLDLSRLEAGKLSLEASKGNIVSFVKGVALSFESLAESKDITLKLLPEKEFIELYFDKEKMMKILTNIIYNAFKFTSEEGNIIVSAKETRQNTVEIKIKDTGIGIAQEKIPKLFDRFYQVDSSHTREYEGTGIGLALTKELVELHHGRISVESEKDSPDKFGLNWTEFTLEFPLGRDHLKDDEVVEQKESASSVILSEAKNLYHEAINRIKSPDSSSQAPQNDAELKEEKTILLVVEDNYDMREYIKESVGDGYIVEEAVNGEQGVRKAEKIIPDLIISDMMMPKMDGNELVRILKNDEKTSHIPIILLTARSGQENKIEGLELGADDYLTKPFDVRELRARIENLIKIRRKLQAKYSKLEYVLKPDGKKGTSLDEKFMIKVGEVIEKHISDEEFNMEEFCSEVAMSRTQLHRKLKALTGKSATLYVRTVKLSKAKKMIEEKTGNISEIAYSLGFSNPAYFTRCFKEEFGYPPSDIKR